MNIKLVFLFITLILTGCISNDVKSVKPDTTQEVKVVEKQKEAKDVKIPVSFLGTKNFVIFSNFVNIVKYVNDNSENRNGNYAKKIVSKCSNRGEFNSVLLSEMVHDLPIIGNKCFQMLGIYQQRLIYVINSSPESDFNVAIKPIVESFGLLQDEIFESLKANNTISSNDMELLNKEVKIKKLNLKLKQLNFNEVKATENIPKSQNL